MKLIEKLFGKKKDSPEVISESWETGVKTIKIPVAKEYSSLKGQYIEIQVVKRDDKEKAFVQFSEVFDWRDSQSRYDKFEAMLTSKDLEVLGNSLLEAAQMVEDYAEEKQ